MTLQPQIPSTVQDRGFWSGARGFVGFGVGRRSTPQQISEARGPAASLRRDALFRRMLLVADIIVIARACG